MKLTQRLKQRSVFPPELVDRVAELERLVAMWQSDGTVLSDDIKNLKTALLSNTLRVERVDKALDKLVSDLNTFAMKDWQVKEALKTKLSEQYAQYYFTKE